MSAVSSVHGYKSKQRGMSLLGMLFISAAVGFTSVVALKIAPNFSEFYSVKTIMKGMESEPLEEMTKRQIRDAFDKRASINYVTSVTGEDLEIEKNEDGVLVVTAEYQVVTHIFANASILLDFKAATK